MPRRLCAVLLAAGVGRRLRPLTDLLPKALCPVGNVALLDRALSAVATLGLAGAAEVAINAWHKSDAIVAHTAALPRSRDDQRHDSPGDAPLRPYVGVETGSVPLGSSGGLAQLRDWIDGRDVVVGNADAYLSGGSLAGLTADWTGDEVRLLGVPSGDRRSEFGRHRFAGFCVIPWRRIEALKAEPTDLVRTVWRPAEAAGELQIIGYAGRYIDSGTPADYLAANLHEAGVRGVDGTLVAANAIVAGSAVTSVIGADAHIFGAVVRSVVWPGAVVSADEQLRAAIRYGKRPADTIQTA
jgi:MurNAc alpha-1-phosphate uridylyltransferase